MKLLRAILDETLGMFIDDGALALMASVLMGVVGIAALNHMPGSVVCLALLLGCVAILAWSALRAARRQCDACKEKPRQNKAAAERPSPPTLLK